MSIASKLITIAENLQAKLDAINVKLTAKGQTEAANLNEVPDKIEAIETKKQDVLNLVSGITKYTDSFEINGELRNNVLVQPSDFSDESTITWSSKADSYFSHSIENIEGSENGSIMVLNPVKTTETSVYNLFWFNSTIDASTSEPRTYLIAVRAKASETITSYFPNMAITYCPTGSTSEKFLYFSYTPTTEWQTFYVIANIPENYYLKDITMCFCSRGITHYIDWIAAYDITGIDFDHMTFGAKATATRSDVLSGKTFYKDGVCYTGTMATKSAATYTPSTSNQTISSGYYLTGTQTIKGDSNLVASNIKSGVDIFGVTGSYSGDYSSCIVSAVSTGAIKWTTPRTDVLPKYTLIMERNSQSNKTADTGIVGVFIVENTVSGVMRYTSSGLLDYDSAPSSTLWELAFLEELDGSIYLSLTTSSSLSASKFNTNNQYNVLSVW